MADNDKTGWAAIINSVKSPIGFFSLVVLSAEAILAIVASQVDQETASTLTILMGGTLILTVVCVMIIALTKPRIIFPVEKADGDKKPHNSDPTMELRKLSDYEILQKKIREYAERHRSSRITLSKDYQIIRKGDDATELFLLENGNLIIDDETGRPRDEKELKYEGSIVGEAAVLGANRKRTASVYVYSSQATLVKLSRQEVFDLAAYDKEFNKALQYLFKLHANRLEKVALYCGPGVKINTESCSVLMGDIHGYSRLSAKVTDEMACPFRFKFTDQSSDISIQHGGLFEDQGDGYKVIFRDEGHENRAMACAIEMQKSFALLIDEFAKYDETFSNAGLGIGICVDELTVFTKPNGFEKVLGHSINVAAAMSKYYNSINERKIYCSSEMLSRVDSTIWRFEGPFVYTLEKLGGNFQMLVLMGEV